MESQMMLNEEINEKVLRYEAFINDVLKEDLKEVHSQADKKNTEISEWIQLKTILNTLNENEMINGFKTKMDIGTNVYVQVNIPDASKILINVGFGIYVEYTINEALKLIEKRKPSRLKLMTVSGLKKAMNSTMLFNHNSC
ncbi:hypothetical protein RUM44_001170 [Polyplax serrata]|uniref:Uncharacterized protein n=1 Tax=Polyplax serrata TaxID=468196 RepID=A0ABR1B9N3_POLSC